MKIICTVCARGGSKGLPNKNIRPLMGKPLIVYTLEQARAANLFDAVSVSSDSDDILAIASEFGADHFIRRPKEMAEDTSSKLAAIRHCTESVERTTGGQFDAIVDLDVTSPLRSVADIRGAVELFQQRGVSNVITGSPARRSPYFNLVEQKPDGHYDLCLPQFPRIERRQDGPSCFDMNAAIYVWDRDLFFADPQVFYADTLLYEMPMNRSQDIDSAQDFKFVEFLMQEASP